MKVLQTQQSLKQVSVFNESNNNESLLTVGKIDKPTLFRTHTLPQTLDPETNHVLSKSPSRTSMVLSRPPAHSLMELKAKQSKHQRLNPLASRDVSSSQLTEQLIEIANIQNRQQIKEAEAKIRKKIIDQVL
jgi:hypothetical protein